MAEETISTRIVANADFSALISDVHRVTASLSKLQQELASSNKMMANQIAVMNRSFADTLRSTGQYSTHFVSLQSDVEKFGKNLDGGKLKLNQYFKAFRDQAKTSGGLIRDLAKQQVAMQNAVLQPLGRNAQGLMQFNVHVPRGLDEIKNKTALANKQLQIMNKVIQDGATGLINWGKNTQWAGRQLTVGLTVPLVAFGAAASKAFKEADQELVRLTKVYGDVAGTSSKELGKVREDVIRTAKEISAAMGVSFKETIGLAADIAATGKTGDELLGSIQETTRLAVLGEVDRQEAMKATLAIQTAFQQNTEELSASINFLNAVENQTSTTLNDLVEAIPKAGPVIKQLGGSVEELALYLTAMREGGINASEGANALKSGLASLINPTKQSVGVLGDFGIDILGMVSKNAGNTTGMLMDLQGALNNLDPLNKAQAIEQLFGKFQFARISALLNNLGAQGSQTLQVLDLMKASTADLASVADRELQAVTESASGKYRRAIESLRASLAEVGEQFLTINTVLITVIDKVVQFANNLPGPVKQVLALAGGFTAVIGPVIMLTGVLANFFGYIMKGVFSLKSFFKGNDGWKYLTPEILAAEKAGKLVEQTFYSDAKAAAVLKQALGNLIDEFSVLEAKAKSGAMSVNPAVSTMAGNLVMSAGGQRVVNPNHPMLKDGKYGVGSRDSSHMVSRSGRDPSTQTIFGMVPGAHPVNQKIGQAPQIYMDQQLPNVPGLTTVGGVSTGVVAGEAAKWHAMMATLGMQSKAEIEALKKTIVATGTVSKEFMNQFDDILPVTSALTKNAATQSSMIVAELRAGKINLDQARAKIVALNLETERLIAATMQAQATAMGRTLNPTMVPTLNQAVVDASGKSNMRELFKKGKTKDFINKIAGTLGVRTGGAGYNIETTIPKKFEMGGQVIGGPRSDTTDTQFAILQEGGFVLNRKASDNLLGMNKGGQVPAMVTPGELYFPNPNKQETAMLEAYNNQFAMGGTVYSSKRNYGVMTPEQSLVAGQKTAAFFGDPNYTRNMRVGTIASDASILHGMGMDPKAAVKLATNNYDQAVKHATGSNGTFSLDKFTAKRQDQLISVDKNRTKLGIKGRVAQVLNVGEEPRRQTGFNNFDKGKMAVLKIMENDSTLSAAEKKHLASLGLEAGTGNRSYVRGHHQRMGSQRVQGREYLFQASPIPSEINSYLATTESRGYGKDLLPPVAEGRGGATGYYQGILNRATVAGGYKGRVVPGAKDVISKKPTPLQRAIQTALAMAYVRRGSPIPTRNMGGSIPGYALGGTVRSGMSNYGARGSAFVSGFNNAKNKQSGGTAMGVGAQTGMFMGGMGLSMAGSAVGGTTGQIMSSAGMAMQFLPMLSGLKGLMGGLTKATALIKAFGSIAGTVFKMVGTAIKFLPTPLGLLTTGIAALIFVIKEMRKRDREAREEQTATLGMSAKGAEELGIKYVTLTEKLAAVREEQKLAADKAKAYFESYTTIGGGLTLTIQQLKELKERIKSDMPETLEILNRIDSGKINEWAANLKAQMIASGKTVEEATNLIYALIESSNKAGMSIGAITDKAFKGITDKSEAAGYIVKNLADSFDKINDIDAEAFASNLDTALSSVEGALQALVGTKDENGKIIDQAKALSMIYAQMAEDKTKDKKISSDVLATIQEQRPALAAILNQSDTVGSMIAKWRIHLSGVAMDLKNVTAEQAEMIAQFQEGLDSAAAQALVLNNSLSGVPALASTLDRVQQAAEDAATKATKATNGQLGANKKLLKQYQDEIKLIKERAEAKKKALRDTFDKENAELELQKAKLELQGAVARGDNEGIASAQIKIQQIQKEVSLKAAEAKIDENAKKAEKVQQDLYDKEKAKDDSAAKIGATSGNQAKTLQATAAMITSLGNQYTDIAGQKALASKLPEGSPGRKKADAKVEMEFSNFIATLIKEANKDKSVAEAFANLLKYDEKNKTYIKDPGFKLTKRGLVGGADASLASLANSMSDTAIATMMGKPGATLDKIITTLEKGFKITSGKPAIEISDAQLESAIVKNQPPGSSYRIDPASRFTKEGYLQDGVKTALLADPILNLQNNGRYQYGDHQYVVKKDFTGRTMVRQKAMGGYIKRAVTGITGMNTSQPYLVGELGPELFVPSSGGMIIPNHKLMGPSFDIASSSLYNPMGLSSSSSSNNVYNIDIDLNGTNVTASDIMRSIKAEMALINAKEGRVRVSGGTI